MAIRLWSSISRCQFRIPKVTLCRFNSRLNQTSTAVSDSSNISDSCSKISTLFVPGRYSNVMYQIVKPVIDVDFILSNIANIEQSCYIRGIEFDSESTIEAVKQWHNIKSDYLLMVEKEQFYAEEIKRLQALDNEKDARKLTETRSELVENLKTKKQHLLSTEDTMMPLLQKIPMLVDTETPINFNVSTKSLEKFKSEFKLLSHVEIGNKLLSLEFCDNSTMYFMSGKLSALDLAIQMYFFDKFKAFEFIPMSCVDFCKSFIIEAIGFNPYSNLDTIPLQDKISKQIGQRLHLCGGASFEAFCAYLTNMNADKSTLPLKYFTLGRRYNARNQNSGNKDLFSVVQSTNIHYLVLSDHSLVDEFDALFHKITALYEELEIPFQTVDVAAKSLNIAESRRKQLEVWSRAKQHYIPVAHLSQHNDFVSKRLNITYGVQHTGEGYCNIIEGCAVNLPVLIGCLVENLQTENDFDVPDVLQDNLKIFSL